ncbi:flagellar hook-associated protein FlgK [bacterium]|nr:flagellar hook-associated protein FlgK [bacterium]
MSSIFGILNTGRQALNVQQNGLQTIGNNISNANTTGYSRQRTVLETLSYGGVRLAGIERMRDEFVSARLLTSNSKLGSSSAQSTALQQLETAVGETDDSGVTVSLRNFFDSLQDLSASPDGTSERESFLARATQLLASFSGVSDQVTQLRTQLDEQVKQQVEQVNTITAQIAELNQRIGPQSQALENQQNTGINQLLDQRDNLINQLSSIIPVRVIPTGSGVMTLFCGSVPIVEGASAVTLQLSPDATNSGLSNVVIDDLGGTRSLAGDLGEGSLGALIRARDDQARDVLDQTDRLAATLARDINSVHRAGYGLDGVTGRDLFTGLSASATFSSTNQGTVSAVSGQVIDESALTFDDYEVRFTSSTSYDVIDKTLGTTVSTGNAWAAGQNIEFGGMRLTLTGGAPAVGDSFDINSYGGMSARMDLNSAVVNDPRAVAAGTTSASGDNRNALAMIALGTQMTMGNPPAQTYEVYYNNMRVRLGTQVNIATSLQQQEETAQQQLQGLAESVSGVSLDEEATNLIQFQRAYEAASKVIGVTDEMLQTIIGLI